MGLVTLDPPWLTLDLGAPRQVLSWAIAGPGLVTARRILWREVSDRDLTPDLDAADWLARELSGRGWGGDVAFLTSRTLDRFTEARATVGEVCVHVVATTGLSNAERVGARMDYSGRSWGTINVAVQLSAALTEPAMIEAMSIAVEARTTAVIDAGWRLATGTATGTGTDCVAIAADRGGIAYAGLHTAAGEAIGRAVYAAVLDGARDWISERGELGND